MLVSLRMIIYICEVLFRKKFFKKIFTDGNKGHKSELKYINSAEQL